jgi:hypothetical protein
LDDQRVFSLGEGGEDVGGDVERVVFGDGLGVFFGDGEDAEGFID